MEETLFEEMKKSSSIIGLRPIFAEGEKMISTKF